MRLFLVYYLIISIKLFKLFNLEPLVGNILIKNVCVSFRIGSNFPKVSIPDAVNRNLPDELKRLLDTSLPKEIDNIRNEIKEKQLLHIAVKRDYLTVLRYLLEYSNIEVVESLDSAKRTALHLAVEENKLSCCEAIVTKFPASMSFPDKFGNTPFHLIAKVGYLSACQKVLERDTSKYLNQTNKKDETPLHIAALENRKDILQLFLQYGADPKRKTNSSFTPLHYACDNGHAECVSVLVNSIKNEEDRKKLVNAQTKSKFTPLILASKNGYTKCCVEMDQADPNMTDNTGKTALHYAAQEGNLEIVHHLLDIGAKLDIADKNDQTALYDAACGPNEEVLDKMLNLSENIDDLTAKKLLRVACKKNNGGSLGVLLEKESVKKLINDAPDGNTLLHISLQKVNYKISKLLLDNGARKDIMDKKTYDYPLHVAAAQEKLNIMCQEDERLLICKLIMQDSHDFVHNANKAGETPLHLAAKSGNCEMIRSLLKKGARLMKKNGRSYTAIHVAAENGQAEALKKLLKVNISKLKEIETMKPHQLHLAASNGHLDCCKIIVQEFRVSGTVK